MRKFLLITLALLSIIAAMGFGWPKQKKSKKKAPTETNFSGIITYMGKVSRIPDRNRTKAKLHQFEAKFDLYLNSEFSKRVEEYKALGLSITITEGIKTDFYQQTVFSKDGNMLIIATPQEIRDYQLTARHIRTNSLKMRKVRGKKRIKGYVCKKMISDIITEDNIRIQLVAWYTPELFVKGFQIPYFPGMPGIPLLYDTYNGEHVVTYQATHIKEKELNNSWFGRPMQVVPMTFTEYLIKMQNYGQEEGQ